MSFYPYSKIETKSLGLLLFAGRTVTLLGLVWFAFAVLIGGLMLIIGSSASFGSNSNAGLVMHMVGGSASAAILILWGFIGFLSCALAGGVGVGIVAMENHLSKIANAKTDPLITEAE